jgi:hypothetical protein
MDRDIDREPIENRQRPAERDREDSGRVHERVREGRHFYRLSPDERATIYDVGRFRTVTTKDLSEFRYKGNETQMRTDLRSLQAQGLVQGRSVWTGRDREVDVFFTLTKPGKKLLKSLHVGPSDQAIYTGFVKPAELRHDAAIYRMFHREANKIEHDGGKIRRVVLDFELKKKVYSPLAKTKALSAADYTKRQAEIAREHGLKVVNGHITLPDLRIEYQDRHGVAAQIDLEVATENYHGSHAAAKASAGFRIYADSETAGKLSRALEEREITAEILSL